MVGGPINTGTHPQALWPGVHAWWGMKYEEYPKEYPDLFDEEDSDKAYEIDVMSTPFGQAPVKAEGDAFSYDYEGQGPTQRYTPVAYGLGYIVTYEERKNNLYEELSNRRAARNAFSMRQTIETVCAGVYNDAFTGNVFKFATGQTLCSTTQPNVTGGTFSNQLSPGADLSEAALEDISIQAMQMTDDRGNMISIVPMSLHIAVTNLYNANRILKSIQQSGTANNDINALRELKAFPKGIKMNHYFTNQSAWFCRTNAPEGMKMFWRERPNFDQDNDFDTRNAKAASFMWFSVGASDPRGILGSNGP
jgi:hypothetical protein